MRRRPPTKSTKPSPTTRYFLPFVIQQRWRTLIGIWIESRIELDIAPRFWQRRWRRWTNRKDARNVRLALSYFGATDDDVGMDSSAVPEVLRTRRGSCPLYTWVVRLTSFMITSRRARTRGASYQIGAWCILHTPFCLCHGWTNLACGQGTVNCIWR